MARTLWRHQSYPNPRASERSHDFRCNPESASLRTLLRTRKQLVREKSSHILRVQKTLEDANIKLDSVITERDGYERPGNDRGSDCGREQSRQAGPPCQLPVEGL